MKTYKNLWARLTSFENLQQAYEHARRGKTGNPNVRAFAEHAVFNLALLRYELRTKKYRPQPLTRFVLRDPKTRVIYKSQFGDRVVHHALVNILQPIYEPRFIVDSYASRKGKGTLAALQRCDSFLRRATKNGRTIPAARNKNDVVGFALKCDVRHYFETVDRDILLSILRKRVKDEEVLWLAKVILEHYPTEQPGKGMPLGNWTSQFFANVYLNELDHFVKQVLKAKHYLRYVDDFVILHEDRALLEEHLISIGAFLGGLKLDLHPTKCKIIPLRRGVDFLGFKHFYHYRAVRVRNKRKILLKLQKLLRNYEQRVDDHTRVTDTLQGWNAYAMQGNTYYLRQQLTAWTTRELERITNECHQQEHSSQIHQENSG